MSKARTIDEHLHAFAQAHPHLSAADLTSIKALAVAVRVDVTIEKATLSRNYARPCEDPAYD